MHIIVVKDRVLDCLLYENLIRYSDNEISTDINATK